MTEASGAQGAHAPSTSGPLERKFVVLDFLGAPGASPCWVGLGVFSPRRRFLLLPMRPIVDVPQYRQNDLDAAVEATPRENLLLGSRFEALHLKHLETGKIMVRFEGIV